MQKLPETPAALGPVEATDEAYGTGVHGQQTQNQHDTCHSQSGPGVTVLIRQPHSPTKTRTALPEGLRTDQSGP